MPTTNDSTINCTMKLAPKCTLKIANRLILKMPRVQPKLANVDDHRCFQHPIWLLLRSCSSTGTGAVVPPPSGGGLPVPVDAETVCATRLCRGMLLMTWWLLFEGVWCWLAGWWGSWWRCVPLIIDGVGLYGIGIDGRSQTLKKKKQIVRTIAFYDLQRFVLC